MFQQAATHCKRTGKVQPYASAQIKGDKSAFEAQTVISSDDPDLRPGYAAWTCHLSIEHFEQTIKGT